MDAMQLKDASRLLPDIPDAGEARILANAHDGLAAAYDVLPNKASLALIHRRTALALRTLVADAARWRAFSDSDLTTMREPLHNAKTGELVKGLAWWTINMRGPDCALFREAIDAMSEVES